MLALPGQHADTRYGHVPMGRVAVDTAGHNRSATVFDGSKALQAIVCAKHRLYRDTK